MKNHNRPQCVSCKKHVSPDANFCKFCGTKIERDKQLLSKINEKYQDAYGTWNVTTEGDVEGRSIRHLGTYKGYLDEVAKSLAGGVFYSLSFTKVGDVEELPEPKREQKEVSVQLNIDSKTWDLCMDTRAEVMATVLKDRPVTVKKGQYFASFIIKF